MKKQSTMFLLWGLFSLVLQVPAWASGPVRSQEHNFHVEILSDELLNPWGLAFLPGGDMLVTEKHGRLRRLASDGHIIADIEGLPDIAVRGQGGLLGIALHPEFPQNRWVYLSFSAEGRGGYGTEVVRGRLEGQRLSQVQTIFVARKKSGGGRHFGSRLVFRKDGTLLISLGDRGSKHYAQKLDDHRGSLIRVNDDGSVPVDNPFVNNSEAEAEIFSYGHRNIQGMALDPANGDIWTHEHGPQGGDELNLTRAGRNYGWPVITYGVNYGIGTKIGEGTHKAGMEQPVHKWIPSIAPSGMAYYSGERFSKWRGDLFLGSLKFGLLVRLDMEQGRVRNEERLLDNRFGRIRDVVQGNDGLLYLLTEDSNGKLLRLGPADSPVNP